MAPGAGTAVPLTKMLSMRLVPPVATVEVFTKRKKRVAWSPAPAMLLHAIRDRPGERAGAGESGLDDGVARKDAREVRAVSAHLHGKDRRAGA